MEIPAGKILATLRAGQAARLRERRMSARAEACGVWLWPVTAL
jgi:hypothetical protein